MAKKQLAQRKVPHGNTPNARQRRRSNPQRHKGLTIGLMAVAVVVIGAVILWPRPIAPAVDAARLVDDPALGAPNAKVTIVEYGDFGCTACRAWHKAGILAQILAQYGDTVRFVWRDFPIITPQSPKAAEAGQCAYDQSKFWEYHDLLYARAPALGVSNLKAYAAEIGLDTARFNQCLDSSQHQATVDHDWQDAQRRGFLGTPSFLINNQPFIGPPTLEELQRRIDAILSSNS
jgi:protein-disulfide isomerase